MSKQEIDSAGIEISYDGASVRSRTDKSGRRSLVLNRRVKGSEMRTTRRLAPMLISFAAVIAFGAASLSCRRPALQPNLPQIYPQPATPLRQGKPPIIFIPGMLGSRLVNHHTGDTVWPDLHVADDQIALPISSPVLAL